MKTISCVLIMAGFISCTGFSQQSAPIQYANITGAIGSNQGSFSFDYFYLWTMGAGKFEIGLGGRFTSYFGNGQYYSSAPASLAADESNSDSLLVSAPQVNAANLSINLGYRLSQKFGLGFNIDAVGFSFGKSQNSSYIRGNSGNAAVSSPTPFNILLVGNNDRGSLNSEFYLRYFFREKLALKAAYQFLFTEYTTDTKVQQVPEANDRFRNKSSLFSIGLTKQF